MTVMRLRFKGEGDGQEGMADKVAVRNDKVIMKLFNIVLDGIMGKSEMRITRYQNLLQVIACANGMYYF